jgi:spore germination cell wall hydrolase CwlJ-like protein
MSKLNKVLDFIGTTNFLSITAAVLISIPLIGTAIGKQSENNVEYVVTKTQYFEVATEQITLPIVEVKEKTYKCYWGNFEITSKDFELLCRTTFCEAGNQSIDTQIMVALTVLNRVQSGIYPNNIKDAVYQTDQYEVSTWKDFETYEWTESVEHAVTYALENNDHPKDMYYFRTKHYHRFGVPYMKSGDLYFSVED